MYSVMPCGAAAPCLSLPGKKKMKQRKEKTAVTLTITGLSKRKRRKEKKRKGAKAAEQKGVKKRAYLLEVGAEVWCRRLLQPQVSLRKKERKKEKEKKFDVDIFSNHRCLCEDLAGKFMERKKGKKGGKKELTWGFEIIADQRISRRRVILRKIKRQKKKKLTCEDLAADLICHHFRAHPVQGC